VIIRHDRQDADYLNYAVHFSSVCYLDVPKKAKGVGTLIHPSWVLTAAHAAKSLTDGYSVVFKNKASYSVKEIIYHPSWLANTARPTRDTIKDVADLALIKLATPVANLTPFSLDEQGCIIGDELTLVGNGAFGNGLTGNQDWDNQWRAATNIVEEVLYNQ
jgi:V8-like Glu-specific endopeptidase